MVKDADVAEKLPHAFHRPDVQVEALHTNLYPVVSVGLPSVALQPPWLNEVHRGPDLQRVRLNRHVALVRVVEADEEIFWLVGGHRDGPQRNAKRQRSA
jgi:hypothetical protein